MATDSRVLARKIPEKPKKKKTKKHEVNTMLRSLKQETKHKNTNRISSTS